jgi:hypothetical protein
MSTTSNLITLLVVVAAGAVGLAVLKAKLAGQQSAGAKFKQKTLLTANELEFLSRLEAAAPELRFFPQVAMGALLDPAVPRSDGKAYFRLRGMFSQKIVDFVAQRRSDGSIVAIIELDDRTHDSGKDAKRDEMLQSAGYRIVRWHSKTKPNAAEIRTELYSLPPATTSQQPTTTNQPRAPGGPRATSSAAKP